MIERFHVRPWEMERFTHRELQDLEEKLRVEEAEARSRKRRLGG